MDNMIWAALLHLSANMWAAPGEDFARAPYYPAMPTDEATWKAAVDFLPSQGINTVLIDIGDAIEYESHPELAIPGAWSKEKMKNELDRIRSLGMTPLPKLNFSSRHNAWLGQYSMMLSTRKYYEVCRDVILEVAELFDQPALFHLGMDEEKAEHMARNRMYVRARQGEQWWHDIYHLFDCCDQAGVRPWIWSDMMWNHQEEFLKRMPKSVMQSNWYYEGFQKGKDGLYDSGYVEAYRALDQAGFDQIPTGSAFYGYHQNMLETMDFAKKELNMDKVKGFMTASWYMTRKSDYYSILNDAQWFGEGKRKHFPELCAEQ